MIKRTLHQEDISLLNKYMHPTVTIEDSTEFPQKPKMELLFDLMIPLLELYPKNPETPIQKNLCTP